MAIPVGVGILHARFLEHGCERPLRNSDHARRELCRSRNSRGSPGRRSAVAERVESQFQALGDRKVHGLAGLLRSHQNAPGNNLRVPGNCILAKCADVRHRSAVWRNNVAQRAGASADSPPLLPQERRRIDPARPRDPASVASQIGWKQLREEFPCPRTGGLPRNPSSRPEWHRHAE